MFDVMQYAISRCDCERDVEVDHNAKTIKVSVRADFETYCRLLVMLGQRHPTCAEAVRRLVEGRVVALAN